jgi:hypothetical protein
VLIVVFVCWSMVPDVEAHDPDGANVFAALLVQSGQSGNEVRITERDGFRFIESNGVPDHRTGRFPNRNNPNRISTQRHSFRMPLTPQPAEKTTVLGMYPFGVATNGVPFDPGVAEFWQRNPRSGWQYEAMGGAVNLGLDDSNAHVQPTGAYHYHGVPTGLMKKLIRADSMILVGYAADGFPIYALLGHEDSQDTGSSLRTMKSSYRLKRGRRDGGPGGTYDGSFVQDYEYVEGAGDLDECNGRFGVTAEYPEGTYHYYLTDAFPFIPREFRGTPDASFIRRGPGSGRPGFGPGGRGPGPNPGPGGGPPPFGRRPPPPR